MSLKSPKECEMTEQNGSFVERSGAVDGGDTVGVEKGCV